MLHKHRSPVLVQHGVDWWLRGANRQNFGDYMSAVIARSVMAGEPKITAQRYFLIGSMLEPSVVQTVLASLPEPSAGFPRIVFWGCGMRNVNPLTETQRKQVVILGVRGPLTRTHLALPANTPLGDPALLLPAFYTPRPAVKTLGKTLAVPHAQETRSHMDLLTSSGADVLEEPLIPPTPEAFIELVDKIASARFVLAGSLHVAIVAAAYNRPFAFWNTGFTDIPFKWRDFAASIGVTACFSGCVKDGEIIYDALYKTAIRLPFLGALVDCAPFEFTPEVRAAVARLDATRNS